MFRTLLVLLLLGLDFSAYAQERMLYVEYRVISPQLPQSDPESQTRKLWLVGNKFMRFEDIPNPQTKVHPLVIVAEPDIWAVDRNTNKGQHALDPGPSFAVHFPMLATESAPRLKELEFGKELAFFQKYSARELPPQVVDGVACKVLALQTDGRELLLFLREDGRPFQVTVKSNTVEYSIRILRYEPAREPDLDLFKPPADVTIQ